MKMKNECRNDLNYFGKWVAVMVVFSVLFAVIGAVLLSPVTFHGKIDIRKLNIGNVSFMGNFMGNWNVDGSLEFDAVMPSYIMLALKDEYS